MSSHKFDDYKDDRVPQCIHWTCEDVEKWIEDLGFPFYKECFQTNFIDGKKLIRMEASLLPTIGITDFDHIQVIGGDLRKLLTVEDPFWNRSISLPPRETLGMYLERKSRTGENATLLTYEKHDREIEEFETKWQPPLSNHCLMLPHD